MNLKNIKTANVISKANGSWSADCFTGIPCWNINTSSILSALIKKAGSCCESYASDLFIDWSTIADRLKEEAFGGGRYVFGFRDSGVDNNSFVETRLGDPGMYGSSPYIALWVLDIDIKDANISMTLSNTDIESEKTDMPKETRQAIEIIETFEDFLAERDVRIPTSDEEMKEEDALEDNEARIYGTDFGELSSEIERILKR